MGSSVSVDVGLFVGRSVSDADTSDVRVLVCDFVGPVLLTATLRDEV